MGRLRQGDLNAQDVWYANRWILIASAVSIGQEGRFRGWTGVLQNREFPQIISMAWDRQDSSQHYRRVISGLCWPITERTSQPRITSPNIIYRAAAAS